MNSRILLVLVYLLGLGHASKIIDKITAQDEDPFRNPNKPDAPLLDSWFLNKLNCLAYLPKRIPSNWVRLRFKS